MSLPPADVVAARAAEVEVPPRFLWVPDHVSSAGAEAVDLARAVGLPLDPEQELALHAIFAERTDGRWAAFEAAVIAPRQNIKTHLFKVAALAHLYLLDAELVVWTAHEFNTAMEAFRDVKQLIESSPVLSRRVRRISEANGEEGVEFTSGRRLRFKARTKTGGRGLTGDVVILDEAFALQPSHMGSLMPTMSAKSQLGNPQILYASSAGLAGSEVLRSLRDRGRPGGDPTLVYLEWCAEPGKCDSPDCDHRFGADGCVLDDAARWKQANLALGRRISLDFVAAERRSMPPEEFARERLGWWDDPAEQMERVIPPDAWAERLRPDSQLADPIWFAVDVSPDAGWTSIGVSDGRQVEVVDHRRRTQWAVDRLSELQQRWQAPVVIDPRGPAGILLARLQVAGVELVEVSATEYARACGDFLDGVIAGGDELVHIGQPDLDVAVAGAIRRMFGDAWVWSRRHSTVVISPLVAVTLARWAARQVVEEEGPSVYEERDLVVLG